METREPWLDSWDRLSRTWMDDQRFLLSTSQQARLSAVMSDFSPPAELQLWLSSSFTVHS